LINRFWFELRQPLFRVLPEQKSKKIVLC
jgi:hypothetical protein